MSVLPKISIVTPSYNQGQFIEQTIQSVLGQFYAHLEYIILDAGSNDSTVRILEKYNSQVSYWHSKPDNGQSAAINEGFDRSSGDIIAWLNSDDYYLPFALNKVANLLSIDEPAILIGNCFHFKEQDNYGNGSAMTSYHQNIDIRNGDYIIQPSSFFNKKAWDLVGKLNEDLEFVFDWEWYIRAEQKGVKFITTPEYLSAYRFHQNHKSGIGGRKREQEIMSIIKKYNSEEDFKTFMYIATHREEMKRKLGKLDKVLDTKRFKSQLFRHIFFRKLSKSKWNKVDIFMKVNGISI